MRADQLAEQHWTPLEGTQSFVQYCGSDHRALVDTPLGNRVFWLHPDGSDVTLMSTRVMRDVFEIPRVGLAACKRYGTTIEEIARNVEIREGVPVHAVRWADGTVGLMLLKAGVR